MTELTAKVCSVPNARNSVGNSMHHMMTSVGVIFLNQFSATRAPLRAANFFPYFQRFVFGFLEGTPLSAEMPGKFTPNTKHLNTVRALDHRNTRIKRIIDVILTENTSGSLSK